MKIGGKQVDAAPASDFIVFPRNNGDIAIRANAVMDRAEFDKLVPMPQPPKKRIKGGALVDDTDSPKYLTALKQHGARFIDWLTITSLCGVNKETQEDDPIEWDTVDRQIPNTWRSWEDDLRANGFSDMERKRIYSLVMQVNSLTEARLDEARNSFLQPTELEVEPSSFPNTEHQDMQPGELANDSESDHLVSPKVGTDSTE